MQKLFLTVLEEEGCFGYAPLIDHNAQVAFQTTAPDSVFMLEKWESVAHLEAHLQTQHMKNHSVAVKDDVLDIHIHILEDAIK